MILVYYSFLLVRAAIPRYRYDQLMKIGWKFLLVISFSLFCFYCCTEVVVYYWNDISGLFTHTYAKFYKAAPHIFTEGYQRWYFENLIKIGMLTNLPLSYLFIGGIIITSYIMDVISAEVSMAKMIILLMPLESYDPELISYNRSHLRKYFLMHPGDAIRGYFIEIGYKIQFQVKYLWNNDGSMLKIYGEPGPLTGEVYRAAFEKFREGIDTDLEERFDIRVVALMAHADQVSERPPVLYQWPSLSWAKQFGVPFNDALIEGRPSTHQYLSVVNMWYHLKKKIFGWPIEAFRGL